MSVRALTWAVLALGLDACVYVTPTLSRAITTEPGDSQTTGGDGVAPTEPGPLGDPTAGTDPQGDPGDPAAGDAGGTIEVLQVLPTYPTSGALWNSYVARSSSSEDENHQPDTACIANGSSRYDSCLHAGERRRVTTGQPACTGLELTDALGAFDWTCDASSGSAVFFSSGLNRGKRLSDLLTATGWRLNHVEVTDGTALVAKSDDARWWTNPIAPLPANEAVNAAQVLLGAVNTLYVLAASRPTSGYRVSGSGAGIVLLAGAALTYSGNPATNCTADVASRCMIDVPAPYTWIEGTATGLSAGGQSDIGVLVKSQFARLDHVTAASHAGAGLALYGARAATLTSVATLNNRRGITLGLSTANDVVDATDSGSVEIGVRVDSSTLNRFERVDVVGSGNTGIYFAADAGSNELRAVTVVNAGSDGISVGSTANRLRALRLEHNIGTGLVVTGQSNTIVDLVASNNGLDGLHIASGNISVVDVVAASNTSVGVYLANGPVVLSHATLFANVGAGLAIMGGVDDTVSQLTTVGSAGMNLVNADNATFSQLAITHLPASSSGITVADGSSALTFSRNLLLGPASGTAGQRCSVAMGVVGPGLLDDTCTSDGLDGSTTPGSARLQTTGVSNVDTFVGAVTTDDVANLSDLNGWQQSTAVNDWTDFDNRFRSWGIDGSLPPARGRCAGGNACRIWDLRLRATDTALRNRSQDGTTSNAPFTAGATCPPYLHGNVTLSPSWATTESYLVNAVELLDQPLGDNDGLCESYETCVASPNFGAYQGEGARLVGPCTFAAGQVSGVKMYAYAVNGP